MTIKKNKTLLFIATLFLILVQISTASAEKTITLMTHDSFNVSKEVIARFEAENQVKIRFLKSGDAGAALIQAILSKDNPMADLFYGVDNTFLSRAIKGDIFEPYQAPALAAIPEQFKLDKQNRLLPVAFGDVCLNIDKNWFAQKGMQPPASLEDLVKPEYKGLLVVENPATSSPGLAFLLATIGHFGEDKYLSFWKQLRTNEVLVSNGWEDAYYGHFTAASKGSRPIVVSYASSPAATVHFSKEPITESPTAAILGNGSAFRQIEFVGILKGTKKQAMARKLVDFLLSPPFQEDIPLQMFVFPVNPAAALPPVFAKHAQVAQAPAMVPPAAIEKNREQWIEAWTEVVVR